MVRAKENWSQVTGQINVVREAKDLPGFMELELRVDSVEPVAGYTHMLAWARDQAVMVTVPTERVQQLGLEPGSRVSSTVRVAGPGRLFVDPTSLAKQ